MKQQKTDSGRVIIRKQKLSEEPKLARKNWSLWKMCRDMLTSQDVQVLITVRRQSLKHEKDSIKIRELRNDIRILEDSYRILRKKELEKMKK